MGGCMEDTYCVSEANEDTNVRGVARVAYGTDRKATRSRARRRRRLGRLLDFTEKKTKNEKANF